MTPWWAAGTALGTLASAVGGALYWLRSRYRVVTVVGGSMEPAYADGDRVAVRRRPARALRVGDVIVFAERPGSSRELLIKRVAALPGDLVPREVTRVSGTVPPGSLVVLGDNRPGSIDSRHYGYESLAGVFGVATRKLTDRPETLERT